VGETPKHAGTKAIRFVLWSVVLALLIFPLLKLSAQESQPLSDTQPLPPPPQTQQASTQRVTVHGTVLNLATSEPIARALVSLEGDPGTGTLTDGGGHFEFQNMATGPEVFSIRKPGFRGELSGIEGEGDYFPANGASDLERNVVVAADMPELVFSLTPTSAIHGHVELSTGDPAENIMIQLIKKSVINGRAQWSDIATAKTNSSGNYRFSGLSAGIYMLQSLPSKDAETIISPANAANSIHLPQSGFPASYYSDAREFSSATAIKLTAGEETQANLNLTLEVFQPVNVKVPRGEAQGDKEGPSRNSHTEIVAITDENGNPAPYQADYNKEKQLISANLPDGSYILYLAGVENSATGQDFANHIRMGSTNFAVEGHPVDNLRLQMAPLEPLTIHLRLPDSLLQQPNSGTGRSSMPPVFLSFSHTGGPAPDLTSLGPATQDTITFMSGTAGRYWANATTERLGICIGSFTAGGVDLAREPLVLMPGSAPPQLELTLRDDCAKLNLNLPFGASMIVPGVENSYTVYVVPDVDSTATINPRTMRASSGGTVTVESLTPGNYHVYTLMGAVDFEYHNSAFLQQFTGQAVTLAPSSTNDLLLEVLEK
jgi:hypothetical protein